MKLFYFANIRIPSEKAHTLQVMKMCEAFADHAEVQLVVPSRKNIDFDEINIRQYYGIKNNFSITKIKSLDPRFLLRLPQGTYIKFQSALVIMKMRNFLKQITDSADTIFYTRDYYFLPLLLKFSKRVVWEAHDLPRNIWLYRRFWQRCHRIVAITQGLKDELVSHGLDAKKILVAHDGVDLDKFTSIVARREELRLACELPIDKKIVLYAGHLYKWKGVDTLASATQLLSKDVVVCFLGGTDSDVVAFQKKYGHQKNIRVLGRVSFVKVPLYLKAADVLILPNSGKYKISQHYTSPLKLFEYMAAQQPIVASDIASLREVLHEENAVLVQPDNSEALAEGIKLVLMDPDRADRLRRQAFVDVQKYTWQARAKNIITFIV